MKKASLAVLFVMVCQLALVFPVSALSVSAQYACLMDAVTGRVLFEKNAHERHSMASTTKIMTALVALEACSLDDIVTVRANASGTEGSSIYLAVGEQMRLEDMLYGLMLHSGNDAAIAIAEHVSGNVEAFAQRMTEKAREIGAKDTQFQNPNGLDAEGHYTTAYDLALITRYALRNEAFARIVATKKTSIPWPGKDWDRTLVNHNKLLGTYPGCIGVKTGFTKKTGRCLVSAAEREGWRVIAVTLNAPNDWQDHTNMLNYAYDTYQPQPLVLPDMVIKTLPVKYGSEGQVQLYPDGEFHVLVDQQEDISRYRVEYDVPYKAQAPIQSGQALGLMRIYYGDELCCELKLVSRSDIAYVEPPPPTFWERVADFLALALRFDQDTA